ncbi:MAG TPA: PepSY domain-containing protein [Candidatus Limnocylindria bacterium]|nr:PepSY domain-containing protein [Candidatus Limnocylindria bacterium]
MKILQANSFGTSFQTIRFYFLPVAFFVAIVGVSTYAFTQVARHDNPFANSLTGEPSLTTPLPGNLLPLDKVKSLAAAEAPRTAITKIQLENKDKRLVYVVSLASKEQLVFDARTGDKLSDAAADDNPSKAVLPASLTHTIDFDNARKIALVQIPDGIVNEMELLSDQGQIVYSVHFTDGSSVHIAAADGSVIRTENETQASETPSSSTDNTSTDGAGDPTSSEDSGTPPDNTDDTPPSPAQGEDGQQQN